MTLHFHFIARHLSILSEACYDGSRRESGRLRHRRHPIHHIHLQHPFCDQGWSRSHSSGRAKCSKLGVILNHLGKHSSVDRELRRHIDECAADLKFYEVKLGKLTIYDNERALGKLWKKIKHVVGEKDIATLHSSMANHIAILDLHLSTLQR